MELLVYDTLEELLSAKDLDEVDTLAQRAARVLNDSRTLACDALAKDQDSYDLVVTDIYFAAWTTLLAINDGRKYAFIEAAIASQPEDVTDETDVFTLLPIRVGAPEQDDIPMLVDLLEANYQLWRKDIPSVALN